jgi:lysophospholipase L1-like esterase
MPKRHKVILLLLSLLLLISVGFNLFLYQQGSDYYLQLSRTRLDPLGLSTYSKNLAQNENIAGKPLVVFFGDSRAADWLTPTQVTNVTFINRGIAAQTTAQALGRFPYHVLPLKPKVIVLQIGVNDLKTIPLFPEQKATIVANCKANIRQIVALSVQNGSQVILTTIFPLGQLPLERKPFWSDEVAIAISEVNQFITSLKSDQVKIFDTAKILANREGITDPAYSRDFLHLNENGYNALNQELVHLQF